MAEAAIGIKYPHDRRTFDSKNHKEDAFVSLKNVLTPIAIIGIGCRFPGAPSPKAFWRLLREGGNAVREVPPDRWKVNDLYDPNPTTPGKMISRWGGFLENVDKFDWRTFQISPREAKYMDPQHRLLLEVAWEAIEDAGLPLEKVAGSRTGVFIGIMWNDYLRLQSRDWSQLTGYTTTGNGFAFGPNRISYIFDFRGPSIAIDGACASSLASVHAACQSIWMEESALALAGGVNLILSPDIPITLSKAGLLSPEGRCKPLDASADGFVMGEGAGIVVLKPLSKVTPSDRVYGVIRGSAMNHNGHNEWIMAASTGAQAIAIREAYRRAGVDPAEVDYIELHGSGFLKGDAIEVKALGETVGKQPGRVHPCAIGSVKSNIGHLESAAGIAGLIKVALSLYHREIPPTLHMKNVNPEIPLEALGLVAQRTSAPWPKKNGAALAGVTAVSMSGINAHVVLEGPDQDSGERPRVEPLDGGEAKLLPLSARSPEALLALAQVFKDFLTDEESEPLCSLQDICFTAGVRRSHHKYRLALVGHSRGAFVASLDSFLQGQLTAGVLSNLKAADQRNEAKRLGQNGGRAELISQLLGRRDQEGTVRISMPLLEKDRVATLEALGDLYVSGYPLEWEALYPGGGRCVQLPTYPWQRERLWLDGLDNHEPLSNLTLQSEMYAQLLEERHKFWHQIEESPPKHRRSLLLAHVRKQVVKVLGLNSSEALGLQQRLFEAGLNSLGIVELTSRLQISLGRSLPVTLVFDYPTVEALTEYLAGELFFPEAITSGGVPKAGDRPERMILDRIEQLSEAEAEALLIKKLGEI